MSLRLKLSPALCLCLSVAFSASCDFGNEGVTPPQKTLNFPVALHQSPQQCATGACWLYVANSNFDLRYNHGTIQSIDLEMLNARVRDCDDPPCTFADYASFVPEGHEVFVGSFANGLMSDATGERLFFPLGSNSSLTYLRVQADGTLDCGGKGRPHYCSSAYIRGLSAATNPERKTMPRNPVSVSVGPLPSQLGSGAEGLSYAVTGHSGGAASLFVDQIDEDGRPVPTLIDVVEDLGNGLSVLRYNPVEDEFWGPNRLRSSLSTVAVAWDGTDVNGSYLYALDDLDIENLDDGADTRDVFIDEQNAAAYIVSRRPNAVLIADLAAMHDKPGKIQLRDIIGLADGPSRVQLVNVGPQSRPFLFVSCFDASVLYVIDVSLPRLFTIVTGSSGPFDLSVDTSRSFLYVADFSASVVRVLDLAPMDSGQSPREVAILGEPRTVKELL